MPVPYSQFVGDRDPFPILESTVNRIDQIASLLSAHQIVTPSAPGKWSMHQIVGHLADTELVFQVRVRFILFEDAPILPAYDQDRWVNGWMRENEPFDETLARLRILRLSTLRLLRNTSEQDLDRIGNHTERGPERAGDYPVIIAGHDLNHLGQMESILRNFTTA